MIWSVLGIRVKRLFFYFRVSPRDTQIQVLTTVFVFLITEDFETSTTKNGLHEYLLITHVTEDRLV